MDRRDETTTWFCATARLLVLAGWVITGGHAISSDGVFGQQAAESSSGLGIATWNRSVLPEVQAKVVKIFGAGTIGRLEPFQSGFFITDDGYIATAFSYVLDTNDITVILHDGRRYTARLVGGDLETEIALLKIDVDTLVPYFRLDEREPSRPGDWAFALTNAFGVATGNEPVSVQHTLISGTENLAAHRGSFEIRYRGPIIVLDMVTNNAGAAGGALVSMDGRLLGMIGKELQDNVSGAWLNFAIPTPVVKQSIDRILSGEAAVVEDSPEVEGDITRLVERGIVFLPELFENTPPYVDRVVIGSPADTAGIREDDLVVLVGNRLVRSLRDLAAAVTEYRREDTIPLTLSRGNELIEVHLPAPQNL
ncbi:S1C family serine protease [Thermostilla marina]